MEELEKRLIDNNRQVALQQIKIPLKNPSSERQTGVGLNSFDLEETSGKLELIQRDIVKISEIQRDLQNNVHTL